MYVLFQLVPSLAKVFSGKSIVNEIKLIILLWYFALTRKTFLRNKSMHFSLAYLGKPFSIYIESIVDLFALKEIFIDEEYNWSPSEDPKIILDLGAHFGDTSLYYHLRYPNAIVYAVEPAPDTFKRLENNVKHIKNIVPIHCGVAGHDGYADLHLVPSSLGNSLTMRSETENTVSVPVYTLQTLMIKNNIDHADLIKFDIEGAEEVIFKSTSPVEFADAYIGEVHEDLISIDASTLIKSFSDFIIERHPLSNPKRFIMKAKRA